MNVALLAMISICYLNFLVTTIAIMFIGNFDHTKVLMVRGICMGVPLLVMSLLLIVFGCSDFKVIICVISFSDYYHLLRLSLGPVVSFMTCEIFPLKIRDLGNSFTICDNWVYNLLVSLTFSVLL
ncbi:MAG: MFS transporter [Eggerthellaceae bacterium]|nr:MFS transporter [Eggerthellaceae bacterium]